MDPAIAPYPLSDEIRITLRTLADHSDVLILGEVHGTQEVPRLARTLLPELYPFGYGALALEVDADQRMALADWSEDNTQPIPQFFAQPSGDGRGNVQVLGLAQAAVTAGWQLLCFDRSSMEPVVSEDTFWQERDAAMARNLVEQRRTLCPDAKVLGICGNLHARLSNHAPEESWLYPLWPSFAAVLQSQNPNLAIRAINIAFSMGEYYNGGRVNQFRGPVLDNVQIEQPEHSDFTLTLRLPVATAAAFLQEPIQEE